MSALSEKLAALSAAADEAIARVQVDVDDLKAKIAELEAKATTDQDLEALDALKAKLDALDPTKPDTLPEEPAPPEG
jgi:primosomal protein N''